MLDFYVKTGIRFSLRDKRLFEITEVEITRVDCINVLRKSVKMNKISFTGDYFWCIYDECSIQTLRNISRVPQIFLCMQYTIKSMFFLTFFLFFYTPPHVSYGVLCFHVGRPCVCSYVHNTYVRPSIRTSFSFDNLSIYKRISFKFCLWICTNNVSLGIVNGLIPLLITELWHLSMYKNGFWTLVPLLFGVS